MSFEKKVVLICGGSSGMGAAVAIKLSTQGAKIAIAARNEGKLTKVSNICERNGSKPLIIIADVTKDEDAKRIVSDTVKHYGKLDVLVNTVGTLQFVSILQPNAMEMFDHILRTNLRGAIHLTHLAAPHLIETKGNIIHISSVGSKAIFFVDNAPYFTSKAGIDHFSRCVALELAPKGVRVNCVNPGFVNSGFVKSLRLTPEQEGMVNDVKKGVALSKAAEPQEVADLILFLASDAAKSITGCTYVIDNGMLLKGPSTAI